jgi:hypothetical protein
MTTQEKPRNPYASLVVLLTLICGVPFCFVACTNLMRSCAPDAYDQIAHSQKEREASEQLDPEIAKTANRKALVKKFGAFYDCFDDCDIYGLTTKENEYGNLQIMGTLVNTGSDCSYVCVTAAVLDGNGSISSTPIDNVSGLPAGQSWTFKILVTDVPNKMKYRIATVSASR